jgi:hypothetical protein
MRLDIFQDSPEDRGGQNQRYATAPQVLNAKGKQPRVQAEIGDHEQHGANPHVQGQVTVFHHHMGDPVQQPHVTNQPGDEPKPEGLLQVLVSEGKKEGYQGRPGNPPRPKRGKEKTRSTPEATAKKQGSPP